MNITPTASAPVTDGYGLGEKLKAEGQKAAAQAAKVWRDGALNVLRAYIRCAPLTTAAGFTMDQFRAQAYRGPEPPSENAWGTLPRAAVKAGLIKPTDRYAKAQRPEAHARMLKVWVAA